MKSKINSIKRSAMEVDGNDGELVAVVAVVAAILLFELKKERLTLPQAGPRSSSSPQRNKHYDAIACLATRRDSIISRHKIAYDCCHDPQSILSYSRLFPPSTRCCESICT